MNARAMNAWGRGMAAALERQNGGQGVVTVDQALASKEAEIRRLQARLEDARRQIAELESALAAAQAVGTPTVDLVNVTQAAQILKVHPSTVSRWVKAGHFQTQQPAGRAKPLIVANSLHRPAPKRKRRS